MAGPQLLRRGERFVANPRAAEGERSEIDIARRIEEERGSSEPSRAIGHALDRFIGTWSAEQEVEVLKAIEIFEQVDEAFWQ
jgi:hypothetical protein